MPQLTHKTEQQISIKIRKLLTETNEYIKNNPLFISCVLVVNMAYMLCFKALPNGIENPLSILWFITYYIFWCCFYRYYYHLRPYLLSKNIFHSITPSTKALVMMFLVALIITFLPMLPLFLGYNDLYLDVYERYLKVFDNLNERTITLTSIKDVLSVYAVMCLLAPLLICKPYLAWISSLRGRDASFQKVGNRTKGNYWQFVLISALLLYPEAIASTLDNLWNLQHWLDYSVSTIIFVYTNIIFAKLYDLFYLKN